MQKVIQKTFSMNVIIFLKVFAETSETSFKGSVRKLYCQVNSPPSVLEQRKLLCGVIVLLNLTIKGWLILALRYTNSPFAGTRILRQGQTLRRQTTWLKSRLVMVNGATEWLSVCRCSTIHELLVVTS